jgi:hypothetical protein
MRKLWLALGALVALSIGIALAEGKAGKAGDCCGSCCSTQSCDK